MHFNTAVATALLSAGYAVAQSSTVAGASPTTAPGQVMVQTVKVGGDNGELTFSPSDIQAAPGSLVQFQFWPKNHSVAQSSFSQPCQPISQTNTSVPSTLWSGFMPTDPGASMMATWTIMINDSTPIWLYCAQADHCQQGMVAAINAVNSSGKTVDAFSQAAASAPPTGIPNGGEVGNTTTAVPAGSNSTTGGTPSSSGGSSSSGSQPASSAGAPPSGSTTPASGNSASGLSYSLSSVALVGFLSTLFLAL